jgi:hypothetical protein
MTHEIKQYNELKKKLLDIGLAIPGTLRETYHRCGRDYCKCMTSDEYRHGPYYLWDRRINGKLTAKSITEEDAIVYREWIENRKKLELIISEMLEFGSNYATTRPNSKKSQRGNSEKSDPATRGK